MSEALCLIILRTGLIYLTTLNLYVVERQQRTLQRICVLFLLENGGKRHQLLPAPRLTTFPVPHQVSSNHSVLNKLN